MKNRHILPLTAIIVVIGALTAAGIFLVPWIPTASSTEAHRVDSLTWFLVIVSGVIFTLVTSFVVYSMWAFRVGDDDDQDGPPTHGNTQLEIIWTVVPVVLLAVMAVWSVIVINDNEATAKTQVHVHAKAWQYAWEFSYPSGIATGDLHVPTGTQVVMDMNSFDVIHGFYVPQFRVQMDVVPGVTTHLSFTPDKVGTWYVICNELCGEGHAQMRARVIVQSPADYAAWLAKATVQAKAASASLGASITAGGHA